MDHLKNRKNMGKRKTYTGCFDNHCCEIAIKVLEEQAYAKGYHDGYEEAKDNMVTAIVTVFTVIGTVIALVGVVLRAFKSRYTNRNSHSMRCIGEINNFYLSL
jgi:hypothetical protein